jgi:hypothetical protein
MGTIRATAVKNSIDNQLGNGFDSRRLHHHRFCGINKNNSLRIGICSIYVLVGIDPCRHGHDLGTLIDAYPFPLAPSFVADHIEVASYSRRTNKYTEAR